MTTLFRRFVENLVNVGEEVIAHWLNSRGFQNLGEAGNLMNYPA